MFLLFGFSLCFGVLGNCLSLVVCYLELMISALLVLLYFIRTIGNGELDTHTHTGGEGALESETES